MTPQQLKNSILQLAIQGRLVEQRADEGSAQELLVQIQAEKKQLIKDGKIKKQKPLPEIAEEEKPFDIPENWRWCRVSEISKVVTKGTTPRGGNVAYLDKGIGFLRAENIAGLDKIDLSNVKYIDQETNDGYLSRSIIVENDLLITIAGTLGRTGLVRTEDLPLNANQAVSIVRLVNPKAFVLQYLLTALNAPGIQRALTQQKKITAIPNLTLEIISNCILPLPPLAEQKRIVTKIEELLPYIDRYEQAWRQLESLNNCFPTDMEKSILQMAIQGKLVEQYPEEGTAEELFVQIQAEKQRLIREGKIKKQKLLPEIAEDEKPFDIPESWKWVRLGLLSWFIDSGKSPSCEKRCVIGNEWGVITTTSIQMGYFDQVQNKVLPSNYEIKKSMQVKKGDVLITRAGPMNRTGISCLVDDIKFNLILSDKILRVNMSDKFINKGYIVTAFNSPPIRQIVISLMSGMDKQQVNISQDKYKTVLIPLPPLAEQKRIVAKLEEILPLCEKLK